MNEFKKGDSVVVLVGVNAGELGFVDRVCGPNGNEMDYRVLQYPGITRRSLL